MFWKEHKRRMSGKQTQILNIEPEGELVFRGPFKDVVTTILKLSNPSTEEVCFKVKTTAPKRYCVRPNCGLIKPNESVNVAVMLQPFDYQDSAENKRHKFLVQSILPKQQINLADVESFWKNLSDTSGVMDSKLKCVFEMPGGEGPSDKATPELVSNSPPKDKTSTSTKESTPAPAPTTTNKPVAEISEKIKPVATSETKDTTVKPIVHASKQAETELRQRTTVTPRPQQEKPTALSSPAQVKDDPEFRTADNPFGQAAFYIGVLLALILGIILGKFIL